MTAIHFFAGLDLGTFLTSDTASAGQSGGETPASEATTSPPTDPTSQGADFDA